MVVNTGILRSVRAEDYGFKIVDMTVAAMLKAYLQQMAVDAVPEQLGRIVSPGVRSMRGGTVKGLGLEKEAWVTIDGAELAALIENAKAAIIAAFAFLGFCLEAYRQIGRLFFLIRLFLSCL